MLRKWLGGGTWFCKVGPYANVMYQGKTLRAATTHPYPTMWPSGWAGATEAQLPTWFPSARSVSVSVPLARRTHASGPLLASRTAPARGSPLASRPTPASGSQLVALLVRQQSVHPKLLQPDVSGQGQLNSQAAAASNAWPWATSSSWAAAVTSCCAAAIPRPCAAQTCCSRAAAPWITRAIAVISSWAVAAASFYVRPTYWATTTAGLSFSAVLVPKPFTVAVPQPQQPLWLSWFSALVSCFTLITYLLFVYPHLFHLCHVDLPSLEYLKYLCVSFFLCQLSVVLHMPSFQLFSLYFPVHL